MEGRVPFTLRRTRRVDVGGLEIHYLLRLTSVLRE